MRWLFVYSQAGPIVLTVAPTALIQSDFHKTRLPVTTQQHLQSVHRYLSPWRGKGASVVDLRWASPAVTHQVVSPMHHHCQSLTGKPCVQQPARD